MPVYVREANLINDRGILIGLARTYLHGSADENRFLWLYHGNPFGPARAWIAYENEGKEVGMAAVFPRRMYRDGVVVPGCVLGDFCVSTSYRSLGPALQLQRACLACARSGEFALAYDFPSTTMLGVYQHLGVEPAGKSVRLVKVLRVEKQIERILRARILSRPVTSAANFALTLRDHKSSDRSGLDFRLEDAPCTSEYSELADKVGSSLGTCTVRSAEYLNWRYRQHPHVNYEFLSARRGGELLAYCTFTMADGNANINGNATIVELFGNMNDQVVTGLLQNLVVLLRARGVATVSLPVLSGDLRTRLLRKLGFWARESMPFIGLSRESTASGLQMLLMHGDRES